MNWPLVRAMTFVFLGKMAYIAHQKSIADGAPAREAVVSQVPAAASDTWTVPDADKLPNGDRKSVV